MSDDLDNMLSSVSELIAFLQDLRAKHGNIKVVLRDPDTDWPMTPIVDVERHDDIGVVITITGDYDDDLVPSLGRSGAWSSAESD